MDHRGWPENRQETAGPWQPFRSMEILERFSRNYGCFLEILGVKNPMEIGNVENSTIQLEIDIEIAFSEWLG